MASSTPNRSNPSHSSTQNADYTRPQEPSSPTNLNRTSKRHQKNLNVNPPPRLDLGGGAPNSNIATAAIGGRLDALKREAKIQRIIIYDFISTVDKFMSNYNKPDERNFIYDICNKVVTFLTNSLYTDSSNFAPIRLRSLQSGSPPASSAPKSVTFADIVKTLKNSGADFRGAKSSSSRKSLTSSYSGRSGGASIGGGATGSSASVKSNLSDLLKREDRRLLIPIEKQALLSRPEPFALRQELYVKITGLTLASIPLITPTRTRWAITPSDLTTRDILTTQENTEIIIHVLHGTAVKQPETWFNYAVLGVPVTIH